MHQDRLGLWTLTFERNPIRQIKGFGRHSVACVGIVAHLALSACSAGSETASGDGGSPSIYGASGGTSSGSGSGGAGGASKGSSNETGVDVGSGSSSGGSTIGHDDGSGGTGPSEDAGATGCPTPGADAAPASPASVTLSAACTNLFTASCNKLNECAPFYLAVMYGTVETCISRLTQGAAPYPAPLPPELIGDCCQGLGTRIAPGAIEACAQAIPLESCDQSLSGDDTPACIFAGPNRGYCAVDLDCDEATEYCSGSDGQACIGDCLPRQPAGTSCTGDDVCQTGLVCALGSCVTRGAQGAGCDAGHPCLPTLFCGPGGTCQPPLPVNSPCTVQDCDEFHGVFCSTAGLCQQYTAGAPGASCNGFCSASGSCWTLADAGATGGTCGLAAADGFNLANQCDPTNGPFCLPPARCVSGACEPPPIAYAPVCSPISSASPGCPSGMTSCSGVCVDISTDPQNCGACGDVCTLVCMNGKCIRA